jgi:hypothetical protein
MLTDLAWLDIGADWPPKSERPRLEMYAANRKLFEGDHVAVFKESWSRLLRKSDNLVVELPLNWPKRLSTLWADLLAGDPPSFTIGDVNSPMQKQLDELIERNQFAILLYDVGIDISRYGDGIFKIGLKDGEAVIRGQCPAYWFPVVSIADVRDVQYHVLAWPFSATAQSGSASGAHRGSKMDMLKVEIHSKGQIEHRVLAVGKNRKIEHLEDPQKHFPNLPGPIEETRIDDFLVHQAPGLRPIDRLFGIDDYSDAESVVQEMEVRLAQIARILDSHADPTMYGPESVVEIDPNTGLPRFDTGRYYPVPEGEQPPAYLTWDGQLASNFQELEELKQQFYFITETSPAAFGQMDAGLATSGTALRRLMQAPLAKARRLRMRLDPVARKVLRIATELETQSGNVNREDYAA